MARRSRAEKNKNREARDLQRKKEKKNNKKVKRLKKQVKDLRRGRGSRERPSSSSCSSSTSSSSSFADQPANERGAISGHFGAAAAAEVAVPGKATEALGSLNGAVLNRIKEGKAAAPLHGVVLTDGVTAAAVVDVELAAETIGPGKLQETEMRMPRRRFLLPRTLTLPLLILLLPKLSTVPLLLPDLSMVPLVLPKLSMVLLLPMLF